jgi:DNA ligase (NAD+)
MPTPLAQLVASADAAYRQGQAVMTDVEFDALVADLRATEPDHPLLRMPGGGDKLLSLANYDLDDWLADIGDAARGPFVISPKVDGAAVALRYVDGTLRGAWTRSGRCAMAVASLVASVPVSVPSEGILEVRGELYGLDGRQSTPAAALRRKQPTGDDLAFVAFEVMNQPGLDHRDQLTQLDDLGFEAVSRIITSKHAELTGCHAAWQRGELWSYLPTDGIVVSVNDSTQRRRLGVTSVAPRYALAMK